MKKSALNDLLPSFENRHQFEPRTTIIAAAVYFLNLQYWRFGFLGTSILNQFNVRVSSTSTNSNQFRTNNHKFEVYLMGTSGSLDGQQRLVVKGRFAPKYFEGILRRYVNEYVICNGCKSSDTILSKENRLFFLRCEQDVETLVDEVQEARRIRLNHQPCKVALYLNTPCFSHGRLYVGL